MNFSILDRSCSIESCPDEMNVYLATRKKYEMCHRRHRTPHSTLILEWKPSLCLYLLDFSFHSPLWCDDDNMNFQSSSLLVSRIQCSVLCVFCSFSNLWAIVILHYSSYEWDRRWFSLPLDFDRGKIINEKMKRVNQWKRSHANRRIDNRIDVYANKKHNMWIVNVSRIQFSRSFEILVVYRFIYIKNENNSW